MKRKNTVGIKKLTHLTDEQDIEKSLFQLLDDMRIRGKIDIKPNSSIMIKVNICSVKAYETGTTVDPFIVKGLVDWILHNYDISRIFIGEADATELNIDIAFKILGWEEMFSNYEKVKLINLSKDDNKEIKLNGLFFDNLKLSKTYIESDYLISVAKLKTHCITGITCILKNQFGSIPGKNKAKYHSKLDEVICDLNKVRMPDLCIVDGIIAMEGEGPVKGIPKPVGLLIIGDDAIATDCVCANIMGFNPKKIRHLQLAVENDLGYGEGEIFGNDLHEVKTNFMFIPTWKRAITFLYYNPLIKQGTLINKILLQIFR